MNTPMIVNRSVRSFVAVGVLLAAGGAVKAELIAPVTIESATNGTNYVGGEGAVHLVDQSGLNTTTLEHTNAVAANSYHVNLKDSEGLPIGPVTVVFDLGDVYSVGSTRIWNLNWELTDRLIRGTKNLAVESSVDGTAFSSAASLELAMASGLPTYTGETFAFAEAPEARYIKFTLVDNYGHDSFIGLSEVRFYESVVPEPSMFLLMACGLAGLGLYGWRRRIR